MSQNGPEPVAQQTGQPRLADTGVDYKELADWYAFAVEIPAAQPYPQPQLSFPATQPYPQPQDRPAVPGSKPECFDCDQAAGGKCAFCLQIASWQPRPRGRPAASIPVPLQREPAVTPGLGTCACGTIAQLHLGHCRRCDEQELEAMRQVVVN
jgi:hypothetical protein